jgi:hypothetical protein
MIAVKGDIGGMRQRLGYHPQATEEKISAEP